MQHTAIQSDKPKVSAYERILRLVNFSDKPSSVLQKRLLDEGYAEDEVYSAIERAMEYGLVDDGRYAQVYIRSHLARGEGRCGIERHLHSCDISAENHGESFEELDSISDDEEVERALGLLDRKMPHGRNVRDKAYGTLMRKGYASSVSSTAARLWCDRMNA